MDLPELPDDFAEFLKSLNANEVDYLLVGGFAVAVHGFPRATSDIDVWVSTQQANAERIVTALKDFGFDVPELDARLFTTPERIVRMGTPPMRVELLTSIDGVEFDDCRTRAVSVEWADLTIPVISLADLKRNKTSAGRLKDLLDLENLP